MARCGQVFRAFLSAGRVRAIEQMPSEDAEQLAGAPHNRSGGLFGHRWGWTRCKIGFHGSKVVVRRPRVRSLDGRELALPTWTAVQVEDWLGR